MVPGARVEVKQPSVVRSGAQGPAAAFWRLTQREAREGKLLTLQGLISLPHSNFPGSFSLNWS